MCFLCVLHTITKFNFDFPNLLAVILTTMCFLCLFTHSHIHTHSHTHTHTHTQTHTFLRHSLSKFKRQFIITLLHFKDLLYIACLSLSHTLSLALSLSLCVCVCVCACACVCVSLMY